MCGTSPGAGSSHCVWESVATAGPFPSALLCSRTSPAVAAGGCEDALKRSHSTLSCSAGSRGKWWGEGSRAVLRHPIPRWLSLSWCVLSPSWAAFWMLLPPLPPSDAEAFPSPLRNWSCPGRGGNALLFCSCIWTCTKGVNLLLKGRNQYLGTTWAGGEDKQAMEQEKPHVLQAAARSEASATMSQPPASVIHSTCGRQAATRAKPQKSEL